MKRLLSFILAVTMVFSLFVAPAAAEGEAKTITFDPAPTVTLSAVSFTNDGQFVKTGDTIAKVKPGQPFAIKLAFTNNDEKNLNWSGGQFFIAYDPDVFEPCSFTYSNGYKELSAGPIALPHLSETKGTEMVNWTVTKNDGVSGLMQVAMAATDEQIAVEKGETVSVMYFLFKPKADAVNGDYTFSFGTGSEGQVNALKAAETLGETDATVTGIDFSTISAQITVRDKDLKELTLNAPADLANAIDVPTEATTYNFTVDATFDNDEKTTGYEGAVWELDGTYNGVTLENGKLTIQPTAGSYSEATTFTVKASEGTISDSKTITLKRKDNSAATVKIYKGDNEITESDALTIPSSESNTYTYSALAYDKYGVVLDLTPTLTFDAKETGATSSTEANTIAVTVPSGATEDAATLTASVGSDISRTITLNIEQKPEHELSRFEKDSVEYTYGQTILNTQTVAFTDDTDKPIVYSSSDTDYVAVDEVSGALTLKKATPEGKPVTITATVAEDKTHRETTRSYTVTVLKATLTITGLTAVDREYKENDTTVELTGGELSGLVPGDSYTINFPREGTIDSADAGTYTVRVVTPKLSDEASEKYELQEISGITVNIRAKIFTPTVELAGWTYGDAPNTPTVSVNPGNGTVSYTYIAANGDTSETQPTAAGRYTVRATIAASGNYAEASCENTFTISKKPLTVTVGTITKVYDGKTDATLNTPTLSGALDGDDVGVAAPQAEFVSQYVGTHSITFTGNFELTGEQAGNYTLTPPTGITGTITAATRTLSSLATSDSPVRLTKGGKTLDLSTLVETNTEKTGMTFTCDDLQGCKLENGILTSGETSGQTLAITVKGAEVDLNGDNNPEYTAAENITIYVQIVDKLDAGLTVDGLTEGMSMTYGDTKTLTWSVQNEASDGKITFASDTESVIRAEGSQISAVGVGEATITVTYDSADYYAQKTFTVTVNKKPITITADNQTMVYGDGLPTLNYTVTEGTLVGEDELDISAETEATSTSSVGNYTITLTEAENENPNYAVTMLPGKLTITPAPLTITGAEVQSKPYDGLDTATVDNVTFSGLKNDDTLEKGTGYTAQGRFTNVNAGQRDVTVTVTLLNGNYSLAANTFTTNAEITKSTVSVTGLTANDAVYTGRPYDQSNITVTTTSHSTPTYTFYEYSDGAVGNVIDRPTNVGTYSVTVTYAASENEGACEASAQFSITQKSLTAEDVTVESIPAQTYTGEEITPAVTVKYNGMTLEAGKDYTVSYAGNTNVGETASVTITGQGNYTGTIEKSFTITAKPVTGATVTFSDETLTYNGAAQHPETITVKVGNVTLEAGKDYTASYPTEANAGEHTATVTFMGNYSGTATGTFTIAPKTVGLTWEGSEFLYDKTEKTVTATAAGVETGDTVNVTVVGGRQTAIGSYTATATALDNSNYQLPASGLTHSFTIKNAIESISAAAGSGQSKTVTATVDGLTIKLTGTMKEGDSLVLTINDVNYTVTDAGVVNVRVGDNESITYTLDKTGLTKTPANVDLKETAPAVETASTDEATVKAAEEISNNGGAQSEGLAAAAAEAVTKEAASKADGQVTITAETKLEIQVVSYEKNTADNKSVLTLEITPVVTYKDASDEVIETKDIPNSAIKAPVTISIKLPAGMPAENLFVKHELENGGVEYLKVTVDNGYATWQQSSFSPVVLMADNRTVTIKLVKDDKSEIDMTLDLSSVGTVLPKDGSKSKWTFDGITGSYDTITKELFDELAKKTGTVTAASVSGSSSDPDSKPGGSSASLLVPGLGDDDLIFRDVSKYDYYYNAVKWAVKKGVTSGTGRYTFSPDAACTRAQTVTFLWRAAGCPKADTKANPFTDVADSDYFYEAVLWAVENGITNGTSKTTFSPNASVTRAQVAAFLWRANGEPAASDSGFTDVASNAYYAKAVAWAYAEGITTGTGFGVFSPEAVCTRAQIVTFLFRNVTVKPDHA